MVNIDGILFKVKRKYKGEWIKGFLFQCLNNGIEWGIGTSLLSANDYSKKMVSYR